MNPRESEPSENPLSRIEVRGYPLSHRRVSGVSEGSDQIPYIFYRVSG